MECSLSIVCVIDASCVKADNKVTVFLSLGNIIFDKKLLTSLMADHPIKGVGEGMVEDHGKASGLELK